MGIIEQITDPVVDFIDESFKKGWLLYAIIGLVVLVILVLIN